MQRKGERVCELRNDPAIDVIDAKILHILLNESRTSFTNIAKTCSISVGAVRMRYAKLKKTGIITGETMQVNPHSLGYQYVSDLGITTDIEKEAEVKEFFNTKPYLAHTVGPLGKYNFWTKVVLSDIKELNSIIEDLEAHPSIRRVDAFTWSEAVYMDHAENLVIPPLSEKGYAEFRAQRGLVDSGCFEKVELDAKDLEIVKVLSAHSRIPFRKIAQSLGISTKNVIQRYRRLRKSVLVRSSITVDLRKLGYAAWAHLLIKVENRSKVGEICGQLLALRNLIVLIRYIGVYDLYATVVVADFEDLFEVTERIRRIRAVEQTDVYVSPIFPRWPFNLFTFLLDPENMAAKNLLDLPSKCV